MQEEDGRGGQAIKDYDSLHTLVQKLEIEMVVLKERKVGRAARIAAASSEWWQWRVQAIRGGYGRMSAIWVPTRLEMNRLVGGGWSDVRGRTTVEMNVVLLMLVELKTKGSTDLIAFFHWDSTGQLWCFCGFGLDVSVWGRRRALTILLKGFGRQVPDG